MCVVSPTIVDKSLAARGQSTAAHFAPLLSWQSGSSTRRALVRALAAVPCLLPQGEGAAVVATTTKICRRGRDLLHRGIGDEVLGGADVLICLLTNNIAHTLPMIGAKVLLHISCMHPLRKQLTTSTVRWVPRLLDREVLLGHAERVRTDVCVVWQLVALAARTFVYLRLA